MTTTAHSYGMKVLPTRRPTRAVRIAMRRGSLPGVGPGHLAIARSVLDAIRAVDPGVIVTTAEDRGGTLEIAWEGASGADHDTRVAEIVDLAAAASADICIACGRPSLGPGPLCWWDRIARG